jgi:hydroxymethylbilane synthase
MSRVLTVVTRRGDLAVVQTHSVIAAIKEKYPDIDVRIKEVTSEGDRDRQTVLWQLKDTGFFTSRLEEVLLAREADFAVHSFKDLPTRFREGLTVTAVCQRRFPEDSLLAREPIDSLDGLRDGARVGTSSLRRGAQLKHLRPDLELVPIRGNVPTRIRKLRDEDLDAILLARAGLERLGLAHEISFVFDPHMFLPAPAQGALAIQTRRDDESTNEIIASLDDPQARAMTDAEREVLTAMKCGCHAPVGAYAEIAGEEMTLEAFIADPSGGNLLRSRKTGSLASPHELGRGVARELLNAGGRQILDDLEKDRDKDDARS